MKKFLNEFKTFISRGNVMDMAVGTIIGAAFTAIVTALSNGILKPIINAIIYVCAGGNADALSKVYTVLVPVYTTVTDDAGVVTQTLDTANSILIDWGAFVSAIINFLLVALVLFLIIKAFNSVKSASLSVMDKKKIIEAKEAKGIKLSKKEMAMKAEIEAAAAEEAKKAEEAAAAAAAEASKPTTESLLTEILSEMKKNK